MTNANESRVRIRTARIVEVDVPASLYLEVEAQLNQARKRLEALAAENADLRAEIARRPPSPTRTPVRKPSLDDVRPRNPCPYLLQPTTRLRGY